MIEKKRCRGQGKAISVKGCGKMVKVEYRKYGLCSSCLADFILNTDYGKILLERATLKANKNIQKKKRESEKEAYESLKSIQRLIQDARRPFQQFIRIRDANNSCISCGDINAKIWHAGHYLKAELYSGLIFNELNCNKQCEKCNTYGGGNESGYRIGLVKKYGTEKIKELEYSANNQRYYKFTREELIKIKKYYQNKIKQLKNENT